MARCPASVWWGRSSATPPCGCYANAESTYGSVITLKEAHSNHVVLADDSRIDTHTVAWVTGVTGAPFIEKLGLPTERGRLKVRTDLQVPGHPDVFAAGDAAAVPDLGPHYAVANPLNIHLSGYAAKFVTRMYHLYAIPRFVNRWAVSLSYLTDVFFDRSVDAGRDWIAARWWYSSPRPT